MKVVGFHLGLSCLAMASLMLSGCVVIRGTTEEWRKDETLLPQEGPGTSEAELCRWQNSKYEIDNGNRIAIGFFPGIAEPGYLYSYSASSMRNKTHLRKKFGDVAYVCAENLVFCIPTIYNILGIFSDEVRRDKKSSHTLFGAYEWDTASGETVVENGDSEDIIVMSESSSTSGTSFYGKTHDGAKLYFSYPGNETVKHEIAAAGRVAVMHSATAQKYRLFYAAKNFRGQYAFTDVDLARSSVEMVQLGYCQRLQSVRTSASSMLSHSILGTKAQMAIAAVDRLLAALPSMNESTIQRVKKYVEALREEERRIAAEEMRAAEARRLAMMRRRSAEEGWRNEEDLRGFALRESPAIWQVVQQLRAEVKTRKNAIAQLRSDLQLFGKSPDDDPDCLKLGRDIDSLLDSLADVFVNLEKAYIAAKKYEASPSGRDYEDTMKRALEDGVKSATMATERYKAMMKQK